MPPAEERRVRPVLRSGTFFTNAEIAKAVEAAGHGYDQHHQRGSVTIVAANSNAFLGRPGKGFRPFDEKLAREAGWRRRRWSPASTSAGPAGRGRRRHRARLRPGRQPEVSIALVSGANSGSEQPYYDVGTAPCSGNKCVNGWTPERRLQGRRRRGPRRPPGDLLRPDDRPARAVGGDAKACEIKSFAGVSASPVGSFSPQGSWAELKEKTTGPVDPVIVVWPG